MMISIDFFGYKFSNDAILQSITGLFGAFLGALLAGLIAIYIMKAQINNERKKQELKDLENFVKSGRVLYGLGIGSFNPMAKSHIWEALSTDREWLKSIIGELIKNYNQMSLLKDEYIPEEIYENFLLIKEIQHLLIKKLEQYISSGEQVSTTEFKDFSSYIDEFSNNLEVFKKYLDISITKLAKMKK